MAVGMFIHWTFVVGPARPDVDLFEHGDRLTERLLEQEECTPELRDSAVSVDRGKGHVEIEASVEADTPEDAIGIGQAAIRAALHAAGTSTPNWPTHDELVTLLPTELKTDPMTVA